MLVLRDRLQGNIYTIHYLLMSLVPINTSLRMLIPVPIYIYVNGTPDYKFGQVAGLNRLTQYYANHPTC